MHGLSYYWTAPQTEFASDVLFRDQRVLDRLFPRLIRRAEISRAANERYLTALAATSITTPLAEEATKLCQPIRRDDRRYRALNPFDAADAQLLAAVNRGEWALKGFRNREIRVLLFG